MRRPVRFLRSSSPKCSNTPVICFIFVCINACSLYFIVPLNANLSATLTKQPPGQNPRHQRYGEMEAVDRHFSRQNQTTSPWIWCGRSATRGMLYDKRKERISRMVWHIRRYSPQNFWLATMVLAASRQSSRIRLINAARPISVGKFAGAARKQ